MKKGHFFLSMIILLIVWEIVYLSEVFDALLIPGPFSVAISLMKLPTNIVFLKSFLATCMRWVTGGIIGILIGVPLGLLLGYYPKLYSLMEMPLDLCRGIPSIILLPLFLIFFGVGESSRLALPVFGTATYSMIGPMYGVKYISKEKLLIGKSLRMSSFDLFRHIVFPNALPEILSSLRLCVSLSLVLTLSSEIVLGADYGLGKMVFESALLFKTPDTFSLIIVISMSNYLINKLLLLVEQRTVHWNTK